MATMDERSNAKSAPFNQKTFMNKYRDRFTEYVPAKTVVSKWEIHNIIDENTYDEVKEAPRSDSNDILFRYIRKNGSLDTIRKMSDFLIETGEHGYPHVKSLGEDMREDLKKYEGLSMEQLTSGSDKRQPTPPKKDFMDCMPSDNGLQGIVTVLPLWYQYTLPLGIPDDYVQLYMHQPMGGVQAMKHWRDGKSGKEYPPTWRFLLEVLESLNSGNAAKLKKKVEENPKWTVWPDQK